MGLKETLDLLMQYPRIKTISVDQDGKGATTIEFFPPTPEVQASSISSALDMPSDDVMLFAATEDPDELMKSRNQE